MSENFQEGRSYVAFISYRHKELDREAAVRIQKKIENYIVPKDYRDQVGGKKLGIVFRDEDELPASSSLSDSITYALDHTQYLIVICTPDLPKSKWCLQEISYFLKTHDRDHVLAVLVDGTPEESFPDQLRFTYDDEGRELAEVEPLAANIAGKDHSINNKAFKKEVVRLFAAIIGCPFDALWQRERRAKTNRLIAAMGVGVAAMAVVIGIVLSKNAQISEQNTQILEQNDQIKQQVAQIREQNDQIQEQNDQISEQNVKLQQQMSSVLVDSGKIQLESFDRKAALSSALEALESRDPALYDHRAEGLLTSALGTYSNQSSQCSLICGQNTAITHLLSAAGGRLLLTADDFGSIRAFDPETGELKWESTVESVGAPRLHPVDAHDLVICRTDSDCAALSLKDGSVVWSYTYNKPSTFQVLSEDGSIFVTLDDRSETYETTTPTLIFLDTADGRVLQEVEIPCENFKVSVSSVVNYYYHYAGDFSSDGSLFACGIPVENEDEEKTKNMIFYVVDMTDGSIKRVGAFTQKPDMVLSLAYYEQGEAVYCAVSRSHFLYSAVFPKAHRSDDEILTEVFDYSLSSRSGFASYDYMLTEMPYLPPLNNEELSIVFSRNVIYLMNMNDGKMRNTINLDSAIVCAEWIDKEEEVFQVFTESGWCLKYDVSHYDNKAIESLYGVSTPVKSVKEAALIRGGHIINDKDGYTVMTREDAPGQILLARTTSDQSMQTLPERPSAEDIKHAVLSPSGDQLMVFSNQGSESTLWERYDFAKGSWSGPVVLPFYVYSDSYPTALLLQDDDHVYHDGKLYAWDGTVTDMTVEFPDRVTYQFPVPHLLSNGSILSTCESQAEHDGTRYTDACVLSCALDGKLLEDFESIENGIALVNDEEHAHLYAAGPNGWIAGWGTYVSVNEDQTFTLGSEPVIAAKDLNSGEKILLEKCLRDVPVTQMILSKEKPLLLAMYETGDLQLFDLSSGRPVLETAYAYGEIKAAAFSDRDSALLILTAMGWLDVYDTSTGERVFSQENVLKKKDNSSFDALHAFEDPESRRMIVWADVTYSTDTSAVILDTDAWVPVADLYGFAALSTKYKTIVSGSANQLSSFPYYSIDELISQAQDRVK